MKFAERATVYRAALLLAPVLAVIFAFFFLVTPARAAQPLTLVIEGAGGNQVPIAIVPFRAEEGLAQKVTPIVNADLTRSGLFKMVDAGGLNPPPYEPQDVNYGTWRARGADAVVIGNIAPRPDGRYDVN